MSPTYRCEVGSWEPDHRVVRLPDGRVVRGRGLRVETDRPAQSPEFGIYLTTLRPSIVAWESRWVPWIDFGLPVSTTMALDAIREAYDRAAEERVEIACGGGVGRTGTAIALMAVLGGLSSRDAVRWARQHHHPRAVETALQRAWVRHAASRL
jgi:hypothetical protein